MDFVDIHARITEAKSLSDSAKHMRDAVENFRAAYYSENCFTASCLVGINEMSFQQIVRTGLRVTADSLEAAATDIVQSVSRSINQQESSTGLS